MRNGHYCMPGNCRTDGDCGEGGCCSPTNPCSGYANTIQGYYCHTARDECVVDSECSGGDSHVCEYQPALGHWACSEESCPH